MGLYRGTVPNYHSRPIRQIKSSREYVYEHVLPYIGVGDTVTVNEEVIVEYGEGDFEAVKFLWKNYVSYGDKRIRSGEIKEKIKEFEERTSSRNPCTTIHFLYLEKTSMQSGGEYIQLPEELRNPSKGLINIRNGNDNKCFLWCHLRLLHPQETNQTRIHREDRVFLKEEQMDYSGIKFPVQISQYEKIERQNKYMMLNVFGYKDGNPYKIFSSKKEYGGKKYYYLNLLFLSNANGEKGHYVLIKDIGKFLSLKRDRKHICEKCLMVSPIKDCYDHICEEGEIMVLYKKTYMNKDQYNSRGRYGMWMSEKKGYQEMEEDMSIRRRDRSETEMMERRYEKKREKERERERKRIAILEMKERESELRHAKNLREGRYI